MHVEVNEEHVVMVMVLIVVVMMKMTYDVG